jgi:hypothetical protein
VRVYVHKRRIQRVVEQAEDARGVWRGRRRGRKYCVAAASADDSLVSGKKKKAKLLRAGELMVGVN